MNYSTKFIYEMAHQMVEGMKAAALTPVEDKTLSLQEVETGMREILRQVGAAALGEYLSVHQPSSIPGPTLTCACGGELRYQRPREASLLSVFGWVHYTRGYYAGCTCGRGKAPLDEAFGLTPGGVSSGLAELLALAGIELAFDQSRRWVKKYLLFSVSENTIRAATEARGGKQQAQEKLLVTHSQSGAYLQERLRMVSQIPKRLYGSIDAAKVRIEPRCPEKKAEETEAWRDMKVGCWYELEEVPSAQRSARQQQKYEREQVAYRAKSLRYYCDIAEAAVFGKLMWARGCQVLADLAQELVFVCDGAIWIWNLIAYYYPQAIQIVDWYHALEHLEKVATLAFTCMEERKTWLETTSDYLWNGQIREVIDACQSLVSRCEKIQTEAQYFFNNAERMEYARFRAAGYAIGSGTVESACKQIVTQRLKKSGAQWEVEGAVHTAKARAAWLSNQWELLDKPISQLPLAA
jgi:hypothetical protein